MKNLIYFFVSLFIFSCANKTEKVSSSLIKNSDSKAITFIIDLSVNADSNEDLTLFSQEITTNVLNTEDFCIEYAYYVSEDNTSVTLYEKYIDSESAIKHGQNFMASTFFDRFFNLFTLNKFIVTGPASDEFKKFTSENGFVIEYRNSIDGFTR
jgi:quinol monooxygenase YgiN|tara:strand:+ start:552 stop:1013 length:462 start_codon:yes stop_codon:yes gene_type:complete